MMKTYKWIYKTLENILRNLHYIISQSFRQLAKVRTLRKIMLRWMDEGTRQNRIRKILNLRN